MTESNKYLWNYETITYTNGTTVDTTKRVIGVYGNKGATGATGSHGYSLVANVVRDAFTESQWTIYGTINHEETWSSTSGIRNGCRIGDMFAIDWNGDRYKKMLMLLIIGVIRHPVS